MEQETVGEIIRLAGDRGCSRTVGEYLPTKKNGTVSDLYPKLGLAACSGRPKTFVLSPLEDVQYSRGVQIERSAP